MTASDIISSLDNDNASMADSFAPSIIESYWTHFIEWLSQRPMINGIILLTGLTVVVTGAIVFFILIGATAFETDDQKALWLEINCQILTVIFTIAALLDQPKRLVGLYWTVKLVARGPKVIPHIRKRFEWTRPRLHNSEANTEESGETAPKPAISLPIHQQQLQQQTETTPPTASNQQTPKASITSPSITDCRKSNASSSVAHSTKPIVITLTPPDSTESLQIYDHASHMHQHSHVDDRVYALRYFVLCMICLNVGTLAQMVLSVTMFGFHPSSQRPMMPIAISLPISILCGCAGAVFQLMQQRLENTTADDMSI